MQTTNLFLLGRNLIIIIIDYMLVIMFLLVFSLLVALSLSLSLSLSLLYWFSMFLFAEEGAPFDFGLGLVELGLLAWLAGWLAGRL